MVTQRKPKPSKYLTIPTRPVQVDRDRSVAGLLEKMEGSGFGGRQLAEAHFATDKILPALLEAIMN